MGLVYDWLTAFAIMLGISARLFFCPLIEPNLFSIIHVCGAGCFLVHENEWKTVELAFFFVL